MEEIVARCGGASSISRRAAATMVSRPATAWAARGRPRARRVFFAAVFGTEALVAAELRFMGALLSTNPGRSGNAGGRATVPKGWRQPRDSANFPPQGI